MHVIDILPAQVLCPAKGDKVARDIHPRFTLAALIIQERFPEWTVYISCDIERDEYPFLPPTLVLCGLQMHYKGLGKLWSDVIVRHIEPIGVGLEPVFSLNANTDYTPRSLDEVYTVVDLCMKLL